MIEGRERVLDGSSVETVPFERPPLAEPRSDGSSVVPRDWVLPGADELFRSIYTRAGAGRTRDTRDL